MHILVTNDDGPPSPHSSPYVLALVRELRRAGHFVSVCLPDSQRSWIGKAHLIGQSLRPLYYRPPSLNGAETFRTPSDDDVQDTGRVYKHPTRKGLAKKGGGGEDDAEEDWILIANGTPASCVQIALHHLFGHLPPIDLVLSGPNYGRNTSAAFALSSGTLGAALEAACCGRRAIALSFAFFSRNHDPDIIQAACRHAVRVVDAIWRQWPELPSSSSASATSTTSADDGDGRLTRWRKMRNWSADPEEMAIPDLYSVNIPLVEGVEHRKTFWTNMLQNYWGIGRRGGSSTGGCFAVAEESDTEDGGFGSGSDADAAEMAEERAREGKGGEAEFAMAEAASGGQAGSAAEEEMRAKQHRHKHKRIHFKWAPQFGEVYKATEDAPPGNDGWTVKEGFTR